MKKQYSAPMVCATAMSTENELLTTSGGEMIKVSDKTTSTATDGVTQLAKKHSFDVWGDAE